jgi:hypothetical protein
MSTAVVLGFVTGVLAVAGMVLMARGAMVLGVSLIALGLIIGPGGASIMLS